MLKESNKTGESGGNWTPSHWPAFSAAEAVSKKVSRQIPNRLQVNNLLRMAAGPEPKSAAFQRDSFGGLTTCRRLPIGATKQPRAPLLPIDIGDGHLSSVLVDIASRDR